MKWESILRRQLTLAASSLIAVSCAHAQDQNGTWLGDSAGDWTDGTKWTDGLIANGVDFTATFGNVITAARTITLNGNRTIGNITASDTSHNYTLTGNTLALDRTSDVPTINVVSNRDLTIESIVAGDDGLHKSGAGTLTLKGTNTFSGVLTIKAGTVRNFNTGSGGNFLGTGSVTIGDAANTGAAVALSFNGSSATFIPTNPISVVGTGSATISISGWNQTLNGPITLGRNLTVITSNAGGSNLTFGGGVTGTGNLVLQSNANTAANSSKILFQTGSIDMTGSITNSGTGSTTTVGNIDTTISAVIGTNVTGVTQNSANSRLVLSGLNTFTSDWVTENNQETWWGGSSPGGAIYYREVVATDPAAGWIELDVPTRYWIKTRDLPTVRTISGLLRNVGIESLSIGNLQHPGSGWGENDYSDSTKAAFDTHASWLIRFGNLRDSWITGVRSRQAVTNTRTCHLLSNGILLLNCLRITVQDCQMRRPQYGGGGGNGYMFRVQNSNECLVRNCIADFSRHGFVISHAGTSGNVFLQCEDRETARATGSSSSGYTTDGAGSDNHQYFSHSNLWDQCHVHNSFFTAHHRLNLGGTPPHGVTSAHGVYWNTSGSGTRYADADNPIVRSEQLDYGYVIGTRATNGSTAYFTSVTTGGNTSPTDHREGVSNGVNTGAGLQPQSLYLDQISRRLRPTITFNSNGGSTAVPASIEVVFSETYGLLPSTSRPGFSFAGWFTASTGGSLVTGETTVTNSADHTLHARWNALPSVGAGPDQSLASTLPLPWSPQRILTAAWFDAADPATLTANAGGVSQWRDKSGNQNHAAQSTASRRPATGNATIGGLNAVAFDPIRDQHLIAPNHASLNFDPSGGANLFAVFNYSGYVSRGSGLNSIVSKGPLLSAGAAYGIRISDNNRLPFKAGDNLSVAPADPFVSQDLIYCGTRNDTTTTTTAYVDGHEWASTTATTIASNNTSPLVLGGETTTSRCADVRLGEFLIVSGVLPEEIRRKIEGYLAHKWALASKLPAGHLHKTSPPTDVATATLVGTVGDAENDPVSTAWSMFSGPAPVTFRNASASTTTATFPVPGTYVLRLAVTDGLGSRSDDVVITVDENPFVQWAGEPTPSFTQDSNADGLADGLAWLLGAETPASNASALLPFPLNDSGRLSVTFNGLTPANRGSFAMRLQHSTTLAQDFWTDVEIPDASATVDGVEFFITPLPEGRVHQVRAVIPGGPAGRVFVRLAASVPGF